MQCLCGVNICLSPFFLQLLLAVYMIGVVWLVRRQIYQVEEEGVERIVIPDKRGTTRIREVGKVLNDKKEVLM